MYEDYDERKNQYMNFSNIKPLLDYLHEIWEQNVSISLTPLLISFYGGEPLLNFKFIQEIVKYFESVIWPQESR
jgi:uncharacterized protein